MREINVPFQVYNGGPVEQDNLYFIHKVPELIEDSVEIADGIYWGGDFEKIIDHINQREITDEHIRFFLGYSGWDFEQLNKELQTKSWVVVNNDYNQNLIKKSPSSFWKEQMVDLGGEYVLWSNSPENPNLN